MVDSALQRTLQESGLGPDEASVYLATLSLGTATASDISTQAGLPRSHTYHVLEALQQKGYLMEHSNYRVKRFSAVDPYRLLQDLSVRTEHFREMLPLLRAMFQKDDEKPRVEFFEGAEATRKVYRMLQHGKRSFYVSTYSRMQKVFPEEVAHWKRLGQNPKDPNVAQHLIADEPEGRAFVHSITNIKTQTFRLLPLEERMEMDFAIVDDKLAITSFDPLFVVVLFSERLARSAETLFRLAWQSGRSMG